MIRLTPLRETESVQELIKDERVKTLTRLVAQKFSLSLEVVEAIHIELDNLDADTLEHLLDQMLAFDTFEQVEQWIAEHQPPVTV